MTWLRSAEKWVQVGCIFWEAAPAFSGKHNTTEFIDQDIYNFATPPKGLRFCRRASSLRSSTVSSFPFHAFLPASISFRSTAFSSPAYRSRLSYAMLHLPGDSTALDRFGDLSMKNDDFPGEPIAQIEVVDSKRKCSESKALGLPSQLCLIPPSSHCPSTWRWTMCRSGTSPWPRWAYLVSIPNVSMPGCFWTRARNYSIPDIHVSKVHFRIYSVIYDDKESKEESKVDPLIYCEDMDSSNGTYVNKHIIGMQGRESPGWLLTDGDVINIRPYWKFRFSQPITKDTPDVAALEKDKDNMAVCRLLLVWNSCLSFTSISGTSSKYPRVSSAVGFLLLFIWQKMPRRRSR